MTKTILPYALIGASGFVGSTLRKQYHFTHCFKSDNMGRIADHDFDMVVCAAAPAQKWIANRAPKEDWANIERLMASLAPLRCKRFVLISTVDVFSVPVGVDEKSTVLAQGLTPYGLHRYALEQYVRDRFANSLIVRLPGLIGPGLRKNIIFDLLHQNNLHAIDSRAVFQFYPMVNLWHDIQTALEAKLSLVHLSATPISVADIARSGFGKHFQNHCSDKPAQYDLQSRHAALFGGQGLYQYSQRDTIQAVRHYAQSETANIQVLA